jgi:hypothetical protein
MTVELRMVSLQCDASIMEMSETEKRGAPEEASVLEAKPSPLGVTEGEGIRESV